jgi:hypothetical protein
MANLLPVLELLRLDKIADLLSTRSVLLDFAAPDPTSAVLRLISVARPTGASLSGASALRV